MLGLILEGGGMWAGFVAVALMALADHGITGFDSALMGSFLMKRARRGHPS